jgi:MFS transporter, BCD family, chlorophyll transporter
MRVIRRRDTVAAADTPRGGMSAGGSATGGPDGDPPPSGRGWRRSPSAVAAALLMRVGARWLPFADAATTELPLPRLLRLGLFQVSVGMTLTLLAGTLNRVMIVELGVAAGVVAAMLALPLLFAPLRALIGHRSDTHLSAFGWRRVPYLWIGTLLQFGGLAIMPFALILLTGDKDGSMLPGTLGAAAAFLMLGAGAHTVQTAGLALATDLSPAEQRPRVVALLYLMLLGGMVASALAFGWLLADFSNTRLVGVIQGAAMVVVALNLCALWKQEARDPGRASAGPLRIPIRAAWHELSHGRRTGRLLVAVGLGAAGFGMQDVLLEPYGGEVLGMGVGATTRLTALMAAGAIAAFGVAARRLGRGGDPVRLSAAGVLSGAAALAAIVFAAPLDSVAALQVGALGIGFGGGLFLVGTLTSAMSVDDAERGGLAVGAWGAVQATCAGVAIAAGGVIRDVVTALGARGVLGPGMADPAAGYSAVFHLEIFLMFAALAALGPLVARQPHGAPRSRRSFGLVQFPG